MKKLGFLSISLLILLLFSITSCKKEEPLSEAIIGKWEVKEKTLIVYENDLKKESHTNFLETGGEAYQFAEKDAGIFYEAGNITGLFTYTLVGSTLTFKGTPDLVCTIVIDKNMLSWSYSSVDPQNSSLRLENIVKTYKIN